MKNFCLCKLRGIYNHVMQLVARRLQTHIYFLDLFEKNHCMLIKIVLNAAKMKHNFEITIIV